LNFWPDGYRCAVFLSFDYDASSGTIKKVPVDLVEPSRGRFAPQVAVPRILDMLDRQGIKTTFFIPGWTVENHTESVENILSEGHEIAGHGYQHEKMTELSFEAEREAFDKMVAAFEKVDVKPKGYRAPSLKVSQRTIMHLKNHEFNYSSNFLDNDMPYILKHLGEDIDLVELPVDWMLEEWYQFITCRRAPDEVYRIWKPEFEGIYELGRYLSLICHPQSIGRISRLKMLEKLLEEMKNKGDVWFPTGIEIAKWTKKKLSN
jgi:peptidoglycan/xylan/chitin deacetylase (PgdA/CDA1 family)